jgi:hypothetical protein
MRLAVLLVVAGMLAVTIQVAIPRVAFAQQPYLSSNALAFDGIVLSPMATSAQAKTMQTGNRLWGGSIFNQTPTSVTNPTVSVQSGYDPSQYNFTWQGQPVTAFPVSATQSTLDPGQNFSGQLNSNVPVTFTLGYNSTRKVSPSKIPIGGTNQTVTMTISLMDSRYASIPPNVSGGIQIVVGSNLSGVSLVSTTNPKNLNQGEVLTTTTSTYGLFEWNLMMPQLYKTYRFSATLHVPNSSGSSFVYRPFVVMTGFQMTAICQACSGSSVTVVEPTLDGNVPGSGSMTFSVSSTGYTWNALHSNGYNVGYLGT